MKRSPSSSWMRGGVCALTALLLAACSSSSDNPTSPPGDDPVTPVDSSVTHTSSITSSGGSVGLSDGTIVVFPAGAVTGTTAVTVAKKSVSSYLDGTSAADRVVISATAGVSEFAQDVEIRVPLPSTMTAADSGSVLAGYFDDASGALTVVHSTVQMVDGKPFAVVKTRHFTDWLVEWLLGKTPPASAGPLEIPYYNQGASGYCWATSLQMVTRAARQNEDYTIPEIVGRMGVDEGGITSLQFRLSPTISEIVHDRAGVRPTRQTWDYVNANRMKDYLKAEIGLNGRPVALFATLWNHAVVFVGYDGDTFYINDPASTRTSGVAYETRAWSAIGGAMGVLDNFVTLAVPTSLSGGAGALRVNILPQAFKMIRPKSSLPDDQSAIWEFRWDHTQSGGTAFRHLSTGAVQSPLPGDVRTLSAAGDIQLSNASRTTPVTATVWLDITAVGAPSGTGHYSESTEVTVAPNSVANFKPADVPVDAFRYNKATDTEYLLSVNAFVSGTRVDGESFRFTVATATPELTSVEPATAMIGETVRIKGFKLGSSRTGNKVTIGGAQVTDVVYWSEEQITVKVPSGAKSGDVVLTRGEVASNALPFTLKEFVTDQSFELTWGNEDNSMLVTATISVSALAGGWRSVYTERSAFTPLAWVKLYFGTLDPGAGGNQYQIDVSVGEATTKVVAGTVKYLGATWIVRSQTPDGLPTSQVTTSPLLVGEASSPYSKQVDLVLHFQVTTASGSKVLLDRDGLYLSFSPAHVGMRVGAAGAPVGAMTLRGTAAGPPEPQGADAVSAARRARATAR